MKLIVLTAPEGYKEEALVLRQLLDSGLETLHVRKPSFSKEQMEGYIKLIPPQFYNRIVLHSHHHLIERYNFKGIHLTGDFIRSVDDHSLKELIQVLKKRRMTVSRPMHTLEELVQNKLNYDYVFLSPLFNSISKANYPSTLSLASIELVMENYLSSVKVIGLGGIDEQSIPSAMKTGIHGVALLGAIWNANETPLTKFNAIKKSIAQ